MSQILRNLISRSALANRVLTHELKINFQQNHLIKLVSNRSHLHLTAPKSYVTSTFPTANQTAFVKPKRDFDELDEFAQADRPQKFGQHSFNKERSYGKFNKPRSFNKPIHREQREYDSENFEGAAQVESTGKATDYGTVDSNDFSKFNLPPQLIQRMNELGYNKPFEIQESTLKHTLEGKDLVGKAFTGSGKTLAFAIPIIAKILNHPNKESRFPKCLVLSPTRELCLQLQKSIQELAPELKCLAIYGGTNYESQVIPLSRKVDIVCATPGRLRDLINRKNFVSDEIEIICLDEADELLTPNFIEQIKEVIEISNKKQMLMFSATINKSVAGLVRKYMNEPVLIDLTKGQKYKLPVNIQHHFVKANTRNLAELVPHYLQEFQMEKCIVFTNMKRDAIKYNYILNKKGIRSSDLHSDLSQRKRQIILDQFRRGRLQVLVATDVAARGLDIPEVNLVINLGFPPNGIDYYIHRSGRTGRAGRLGNSILIDDGTSNIDNEIFKIIKFNRMTVPDEVKNSVNSTEEAMSDFEDENEDMYDRRPSYNKKFNSFNNRKFSNSNQYNSGGGYNRRNFNDKFNVDE